MSIPVVICLMIIITISSMLDLLRTQCGFI